MRIVNDKRGLAPIIATVLLILMVVALVTLIFIWAKGFVGERTNDYEQSMEKICSAIDFGAEVSGVAPNYDLEILNRGNIDILSFKIKMSLKGDVEISDLNLSVGSSKIEKTNVALIMSDGNYPDVVEIVPVTNSVANGGTSKKPFICFNDGVELIW